MRRYSLAETQVRIHEVPAEFFERPHYPAATMVGVADLLHEDVLVEIEMGAEIPDDDGGTETVTGDEWSTGRNGPFHAANPTHASAPNSRSP